MTCSKIERGINVKIVTERAQNTALSAVNLLPLIICLRMITIRILFSKQFYIDILKSL